MNKRVLLLLSSHLLFTIYSYGQSVTVTNANIEGVGGLRAAMNSINSAPDASNSITIQSGISSFTGQTFNLPPILIGNGNSLTIISNNSGGTTYDGGSTFRGFFGHTGNLTVQNINISNVKALGGAGGTGSGGGGGGMGAGGAVFVNSGATVILNTSPISNAQAVGGVGGTGNANNRAGGGGGGMGGNGGTAGPQGAANITAGGGGGGLFGNGGAGSNTGGGGGGGGLFGTGGDGSTANWSLTGPGGGGGGGSSTTASGNGGSGSGTTAGTGGTSGGGNGGTGGTGGTSTSGSPGSNFGGGGGGGGGSGGPNTSGGAGGLFGGGGSGGTGVGAGSNISGAGGFAGGGAGGSANNGTGVSSGGIGGFGGGGGGSIAGNTSLTANGVSGGFGGGGSGAAWIGSGGSGGPGSFGGTGGGGTAFPTAGGGGGGAGLGGAFFIYGDASGHGTLVIQDGTTFSGSSVTAGAGGSGGNGGTAGTSGQALGVDIFMMSSGQLTFSQSGSLTVSSNIVSDNGAGGGSTSTGGLTMNGSGSLTLGGANTYTGSTSISGGGTVSITADNNLGAAANSLSLSNGTLQTTGTFSTSRTVSLPTVATTGTFNVTNVADVYTIGSSISGAGSLGTAGAGTLSLPGTGSYSYTGSTTIGGTSTLALSGAGSLATSAGVVANATFDVTGVTAPSTSIVDLGGSSSGAVKLGTKNLTLTNPTSTFAGVISDTASGSLTKQGAGTFTLSGVNTYTGGTSLDAGQITLGNSSGLGTGALAMSDTTTLGLDNSVNAANSVGIAGTVSIFVDTGNTGTLSGVISSGASSTLTKTGTGTLVLSNTNTYTNSTAINGGTISITADANLGNPTNPLSLSDGTLQTTGTFTTSRAISLPTLGATGTFNVTSGTYTIGSTITGAGSLRTAGAGTLSLPGTGSYSYTGSTTIGGTSTLALSGTGTLASSSGIVANATFDVSGVTTTSTSIVDLSGSSSGAVKLGANNLILTNPVSTFSGAISGSGGSLTKQNSGTFTLSGTNTYTGATTVSGGILQAGAADTFSPTSAHAIAATLNLNTFNQTINTISGSGSITLNGATLTTGAAGTTSFAGAITDGTTSGGGLTKQNSGTFSLSGTNTYTGPTTVSAGTLQAGAANTFSASSAHTITGTLDLNTFSQTINTISGSGSITLNGGTLTTGAGSATSFAGAITDGTTSGGGLTKQNSGTFSLSGTNTYTGPTTVSAGTLQAGAVDTFSASSDVTVDTSGILNVNSFNQTIGLLSGSGSVTLGSGNLTNGTSGSSTFSGVISDGGSGGQVTKQGTGTLILTGANTYTGLTTITAGTLQGDTSSLPGNIANSATLVFDQATTGTYAATFTGSGSVIKQNSGNLILSSAGNTTGTTTVNGGRLSVDGNLTTLGGLTINSGATLGGNNGAVSQAIVGPVMINSGGTLAPGNSIGTLDVVGNVTLGTNATFQTEINAAGEASLLNTTGFFTIGSNDTLFVTIDPGVYPPTQQYVVVNAASGVIGQFTTLATSLPTFRLTVSYPMDEVVLSEISTVPFSTVIVGGNAGAVATCLDSLSTPTGSDAQMVIAELRMIPTVEGLTDALDLLQPSQFTALALAQENTMLYTSDTIFYRLRQSTEVCRVSCKSKTPKECPHEKRLGFWITPYGGFASQKKKNAQPGFNTLTGGVTTGFDVTPWNHWIVGGALCYSYDHLKWRENFGHANIQDGFGAFYTGFSNKHAYVFGTLLGSYDHYHTTRHIEIESGILTEIHRTAKGSHNGWHASGHVQAGLLFGKKAQFSPFVQANYIYVHETGFNEHGAESLDLRVHKKNSDLLEGEVGFEIARCFSSSTNKFSPFAGFSVIREWRFRGKHMESSFKGSSCVMKTTGMNPDRTLYSPTAGMTFLLPNENRTLSFEYKGKFGEKFYDNRVLAQFLIRF